MLMMQRNFTSTYQRSCVLSAALLNLNAKKKPNEKNRFPQNSLFSPVLTACSYNTQFPLPAETDALQEDPHVWKGTKTR